MLYRRFDMTSPNGQHFPDSRSYTSASKGVSVLLYRRSHRCAGILSLGMASVRTSQRHQVSVDAQSPRYSAAHGGVWNVLRFISTSAVPLLRVAGDVPTAGLPNLTVT